MMNEIKSLKKNGKIKKSFLIALIFEEYKKQIHREQSVVSSFAVIGSMAYKKA